MDAALEPIILDGRFVRLEPLAREHAEGLAEVCDEELFRWHFPPAVLTAGGFREQIAELHARPTWMPYAQVLRETGQAIGVTCYIDVSPADRALEIGHTWIGREWHGTKVNPDAKLMLLAHAFESGFERVQLKTDGENLHSQAAIAKLGAKKEGVLRQNKCTPSGRIRDSVVYSILALEWPDVRAGLLARLG